MALTDLVGLLPADTDAAHLLARLADGDACHVGGVSPPARPYVLAGVVSQLRRSLAVVVSRQDRAADLAASLRAYLPAHVMVDAWPAPDSIPYERLPRDPAAAAARLGLLSRLVQHGIVATRPFVLVIPARGLLQLLMPPEQLRATATTLTVDGSADPTALLALWSRFGYEVATAVEAPGQCARRGGIIDIWPPTNHQPVRIELLGSSIESLRSFDPTTQRSSGRLQSLLVPPPLEVPAWEPGDAVAAIQAEASVVGLRAEALGEWQAMLERLATGQPVVDLDLLAPYLIRRPVSLLSYLPSDCLVAVEDEDTVDLAGLQVESQAEELRKQFESEGELPGDLRQPFLSWNRARGLLDQRTSLRLAGGIDDAVLPVVVNLAGFAPAATLAGQTDRLAEIVRERQAQRQRTVVVTEQSERVTELLAEHDIYPMQRKTIGAAAGTWPEAAPPPPGTVEVVHGNLGAGWQHDRLATLVLTDTELFGWLPRRRSVTTRRSQAAARGLVDRLRPGDYVVHIEHGVARYAGLITREAGGVQREFMLLEYAAADRLFVPIDQTDRVMAYQASGTTTPALARLGSPDWERTKRRVRRAVADLAQELLALHAARALAKGHAYPPDTPWQREMEEAFPYQETPDQHRAIVEVKADMESSNPMDRLICGDVGYGKTEVALRAAFKAVADGRQVAVLAPTTVLALQHLETFSQRVAAFPVTVEMLSRLRTSKQIAATVEGLATGAVDIVIGTHRLLQHDVTFRNLGLVIVDEEQRFGVRHKERLKRLRTEVDVLTLSATPIPRTLHMSLIGVRDMSLIETPPEARLPIRTFVRPASDDLIREVILRELDRGGQVYFVHNRVQSIPHVHHRLQRLVPEARLTIGHGQMDETTLEQVMLAFVRHEADVLLCTTIIESGLDIPNVNTLIVDDATHFGLAQLYQLRGRVGRSSARAYAYLLYDATKPISPEAQQRLEAIQEATDLGSGFRLALRDLELRGAGNLLGAEQHGHLEAVGFELYTRMLAHAVEMAKGNPVPPEIPPITLDLPLDAHLPTDYVADSDVRLALYQRLAVPMDDRAIREIQRELADRFGPLPAAAENLLTLVRLKARALALGIESIGSIDNELVIRPVPTRLLDERAVQRLGRHAIRLTPTTVRLARIDLGEQWLPTLVQTLDLIEEARDRAAPPAGRLAASSSADAR